MATLHHVRSADNLADLLTRGLNEPEAELTAANVWWRGPPWLSEDKLLSPPAHSDT